MRTSIIEAESAALTENHRHIDMVSNDKRRSFGSTLVPKRASISVDWCAKQGLMSSSSMRRLIKENKKEQKELKRWAKTKEKKKTQRRAVLQSSVTSVESDESRLEEKLDSTNNQAPEMSNSTKRTTERNPSPRLSELQDELLEPNPSDGGNPSKESFYTSRDGFDDDDEEDSIGLEDIIGLQKNIKQPQDVLSRRRIPDHYYNDAMQVPVQFSDDLPAIEAAVTCNDITSRSAVQVPNQVEQTTLPRNDGEESKLEYIQKMKKQRRRTTEVPSSGVAIQKRNVRKQSTLLPTDTAQDASWFADRGLMSRRSMKIMQKEMKNGLVKPRPLINIDDISLGSDVSGPDDQNECNCVNDCSAEEGNLIFNYAIEDEEKKIDDTNMNSLSTSQHSDSKELPFLKRVSEIDDDNGSSLEEGNEQMHVTIQIPKQFGDDVSALDFNWQTSSRSLQSHWIKNGGGSVDEYESSSDSDNGDDDIEKIERLYNTSSYNVEVGGQSQRKASILKRKTEKLNSSSSLSMKHVSFNASYNRILGDGSKLEEDSAPVIGSNTPPVENEVIEQRPPLDDLPNSAKESVIPKNSAPSKDKETTSSSSSVHLGVDNVSCATTTSCADGVEEERNRELAEMVQSVLESKRERRKVGLSPDEVEVLHKLVKRLLSQESESDHPASDAQFEDANALLGEKSVPVQNVKQNFNRQEVTNNKSKSHAEMLAKVAREMSASLEQSRSLRSKQETRSGEVETENNAAHLVLTKQLLPSNQARIAAKRPPSSQPSPAKEDCPEEETVKIMTTTASKDPNDIPCDDNIKVRDGATNKKHTLQDLIGINEIDDVDDTRSDHCASMMCLDHPSIAAHSSSAQQQRRESEALHSPNDATAHKMVVKQTKKVAKTCELKQIRKGAKTNIDTHEDILTLGINNLSVTMLVNIYGRLREMSLLGHASVKLQDIDVNSHQRNSRMKELKRLNLLKPEDKKKGYLETTLTAGFIVRAAIDEYEMFESAPVIENGALSQVKKASMVYDATVVSDFKAWVAESLTKSFDGHCFEEGSVMRDLVDSSLEVVWISDRHPNDVNYCICVNRMASRVIVVFRGDEGVLRRVKDSKMMDYENPLADELGNCTEFIRLRAAVSKNILTPRLDTKINIVQEINDRFNKIRGELTGGNPCHLTICGHNLGGGLATVTGFYLGCNKDLNEKLASPVQIVTFASPRVGDKEFQRSFEHLEDSGRVLHARFTNMNDMLSLRPFWGISGSWKFEDWYKHVGMHICLGTRSVQGFDLNYRRVIGLPDELWNLIKSYFCGSSKKSSILEYHRRMKFAKKQFSSKQKRLSKRKRKKLITLEECYSLQQECFTEFDGDIKGSNLSLLKLVFVAFFIVIEVGLLLRIMVRR